MRMYLYRIKTSILQQLCRESKLLHYLLYFLCIECVAYKVRIKHRGNRRRRNRRITEHIGKRILTGAATQLRRYFCSVLFYSLTEICQLRNDVCFVKITFKRTLCKLLGKELTAYYNQSRTAFCSLLKVIYFIVVNSSVRMRCV